MALLGGAVVAGGVGLLGAGGMGDAEYVPRLRVVCLGASGVGLLAVAVAVGLRVAGWRRAVGLLSLLAIWRVAYAFLLNFAVLVTGWLAWAGEGMGGAATDRVLHYTLGCMLGAFVSLFGLLVLAASARPWRMGSVPVILLMVLLGWIAFATPGDRTLLPHPFESGAPAPATAGPSFLEVIEDGARAPSTRVLAAASFLRHLVSARGGWGGAIREELLAQFRGAPDAGVGARLGGLERALLGARRHLGTRTE